MRNNKAGKTTCAVMALILTACMTTGFAKAAPVQPDQSAAAAAQTETQYQQIPCPLDQYFLQAQAVSAQASAKEAEGDDTEDAFVDEMGADSINFSAVTSAGSFYYVFHTDMSLDQKTVLNIFDEKGQDAGTVELALGEDGYVGGCSVLPDGKVCIVTNGYDEAADQFPWEIVCMSIEPEVTQDAAAAAAASNEAGQAAVTAQPGPVKVTEAWKRLLSTSEDFFLRGMVSTDQETFLLTENEIIVCSNVDGTEVKKIALPSADFSGSISRNEAGQVLLAAQDQAGVHVWKLDSVAGTYAESLIPTDHPFMLERLAPGSSGFDFYYAAEDGIYGFKTDGSAPALIFDYAKSGLQIEAVDSCAVVSAGSILMVYFNEEAGSCAVLLQAVPQQAAPQQGA